MELVVLGTGRRGAGVDVGDVDVGATMAVGRPSDTSVSIDRKTLVDNAPHEQKSEVKELPRSTCPWEGKAERDSLEVLLV